MDETRERQIEQMRHLVQFAEPAFQHAECVLTELANFIAQREGKTCTGKEVPIDPDLLIGKPKMEISHRINGSCPLHGQPKPGESLRIQVGSDPTEVSAARDAIEQHGVLRQLKAQQRAARVRTGNALEYLARFYKALGWKAPTDGNPKVVEGLIKKHEFRIIQTK